MSSDSSPSFKIESLPIFVTRDDEDSTVTNIKLLSKNLQKVLLDPRVADSKLMVISIYGPQRTGKSFLMNFCIRYLRKKRIESLISNQEPLDGFGWGSNPRSQTGGLYIWAEPYITELSNRSKVSVILLDCQGPFDNRTTVKEIISMYAFCSLLSSLQIFNLFNQITEINLQWISLTAEYANLFQSKSANDIETKSETTHQSIFFMLRDWCYSYEFFYGAAGGQQYINRFLSTEQKNLPSENIRIRNCVHSKFKDINCFLMPHPGTKTLMSENFDGKWESLSDEFQEHMHNLMKNLFSPSNIIVKEVGDEFVTGREMMILAEEYYQQMMSADKPKPETIFNASAKHFHYNILNECLKFYAEKMNRRHLHSHAVVALMAFHDRCKMDALSKYDNAIKFGSLIFSEGFRTKLRAQIDEDFVRFYAFHPVEPAIITGMLSVIVVTIVFLSAVGGIKMALEMFGYRLVAREMDVFILISVIVLLVYCVGAFKMFYHRLNIHTEMQNALRNQFLN